MDEIKYGDITIWLRRTGNGPALLLLPGISGNATVVAPVSLAGVVGVVEVEGIPGA